MGVIVFNNLIAKNATNHHHRNSSINKDYSIKSHKTNNDRLVNEKFTPHGTKKSPYPY